MKAEFKNVITDYTNKFHESLAPEESNTVSSALGSWLLLAALAVGVDYSTQPSAKALIEERLCTTVEQAEEMIKEITNIPQLNYVAHAWSNNSRLDSFPVINKWWKDNKTLNSTPQIPSKQWLDNWANKNTNGLIPSFPLEVDSEVVLLAANIIYSKFSWESPFEVVENNKMAEKWDVPSFLFSKKSSALFVKHENSMFVHLPVYSQTKEIVHLVMALGEVTDSELLSATVAISDPWKNKVVPYNEIEAIPGLIEFEKIRAISGPAYEVTLPAWTAESSIDLMEDERYGFVDITRIFSKDAKRPFTAEAKQVAVSKFKRKGFEAAAVTAYMMRAASFMQPVVKEQDLIKVNFAHKFGYVCTIEGLPVFSGIIKEADAETE